MRKFTKRELKMQAQMEALEKECERRLRFQKQAEDEAKGCRLEVIDAKIQMWHARKGEAEARVELLSDMFNRLSSHECDQMSVSGMVFSGLLK